MKFRFIIGADVSKASLDLTVLREEEVVLQECIANTRESIQAWLKKLKQAFKAGGKNTLFCLEHTGPYTAYLIKELCSSGAPVWVESALQIKRSLGIQRGKNDRVDSLRIAQYACLKKSSYRPFLQERKEITRLKELSGLRGRLQQAVLSLQKPLTEGSGFQSKALTQEITRHCRNSLNALRQDLKTVQGSMLEEIHRDHRLSRQYQILTSIQGIGPVVAMELIIATNEFLKFSSSRQFACYAGMAPFEHSSGSSVKGKTRVSTLANRKLKQLLFLPALNVIRNPGPLKDYYLRKVAEGHPKMSVINAVKNKIIHRVFACIQGDRLYQKEYKPPDL